MRYNFSVHQLDRIYFFNTLCIVRHVATHATNWNVWIANLVKIADAVVMKKQKPMIQWMMNSKNLKRS